jgi:hypothetical protein
MTPEAREAMAVALSAFVTVMCLASLALGWAWGAGVLRDFAEGCVRALLPAGKGRHRG